MPLTSLCVEVRSWLLCSVWWVMYHPTGPVILISAMPGLEIVVSEQGKTNLSLWALNPGSELVNWM
jgi:hypothetical protein